MKLFFACILAFVIITATQDINQADINRITEYTTKFNANNAARKNNITLACKSIDEKIILPGESFSYNDALGPTTKENGYMLAQIFIKGKKTKGYGGGVCQVSSTLYNAVLDAEFEVTERHPHSRKVWYVPKDKDAATAFGSIDFKFVNNKDYPVKINSYIYNNTVTVALEKV